MDEAGHLVAEKVVERLRRIRELDHGAAPARLLDELRELVVEAEEWARLEGDDRAKAAVADLDEALEATREVRPRALISH